jgi:catechol 2,3-dioxygenase-like lactoylglutathione lyase family enzyme
MGFPEINGFGHIDLTVTDVQRSVRWWEEVMGFRLVVTDQRPGFKVCNVLDPSFFAIGLVEHSNRVTDRFDERAVGLDHLALGVPDRAALEAWAKHLDDLGSRIPACKRKTADP